MVEVDTEGFTQLAMGSQEPQQPMGGVQYSPYQDKACFAEFFMHPRENKQETLKQGRPIFEEILYVKIMIPGDKTSEIQRPARLGASPQHDNQKFAHQYAIFQQGQGASQALVGTPLKEWPPITAALVKELEYYEIRTVEQLAQVNDNVLQKFMGLGTHRQKAIDWLVQAKDGQLVSQLRAELDERDNRISAQDEAIKDLAADIQELKSAGSGKPRRKLTE